MGTKNATPLVVSSFVTILLTGAAPGCTCGSGSRATNQAAPPDAAPTASAAVTSAPSPSNASGDRAAFSAPIAATRAGGTTVIAGLDAGAGVIRVVGTADGQPTWSSVALTDVAWTPDAELSLQAAHGGIVLVWRGRRGGDASVGPMKTARTLVSLGPHGEVQGTPAEIGPGFCVTDAGVAWIESRGSGDARVMARAWSDAAVKQVGSVAADRAPALACGDRDVVVLGDGDDDVTMGWLTPGEPSVQSSGVAIRDADFGDDEERDHDAYTVGDRLGILRIGSSGALALRDVTRGAAPSPWHRLKHTVPADDEVVAVDGNDEATVIVYTEDADDACPGVGSNAEAVHALRVVRATGAESVFDLAPADCQRAPGPFWIASTPLGQAVGWVERIAKASPATAPIGGASIRLLTSGGVQSRHIERASDALVDGGCDVRGCFLAALERPADADGMQPESVAVLPYP